MNITYRFENERNPVKEKEFILALIEFARKHPVEEVNRAKVEIQKEKVAANS